MDEKGGAIMLEELAFEIAKDASEGFNAFLATHPDALRIRAHFECDQGDAGSQVVHHRPS